MTHKTISLCDRCAHSDFATMRMINESRAKAGIHKAEHIWCFVTDQPENPRFDACPYFVDYYKEANNG